MKNQDIICQAIGELKLLKFQYDGHPRVVEPHQLAHNRKGNLALSAYWVDGYSESNDTNNRWREYLMDKMSALEVLDEKFDSPRPGYKKTPNKRYYNAVCEL